MEVKQRNYKSTSSPERVYIVYICVYTRERESVCVCVYIFIYACGVRRDFEHESYCSHLVASNGGTARMTVQKDGRDRRPPSFAGWFLRLMKSQSRQKSAVKVLVPIARGRI